MIKILATLALLHKIIWLVVILVIGFAIYVFLHEKYPKTVQTIGDILEEAADALD